MEVARKCLVDISGGVKEGGGLMNDEETRLWCVKRSEKWGDFYREVGV